MNRLLNVIRKLLLTANWFFFGTLSAIAFISSYNINDTNNSSEAPKIDPNATLSEIAAQRDGSVPVEEEPRRPKTVAESQEELAKTLDKLDEEDFSRGAS